MTTTPRKLRKQKSCFKNSVDAQFEVKELNPEEKRPFTNNSPLTLEENKPFTHDSPLTPEESKPFTHNSLLTPEENKPFTHNSEDSLTGSRSLKHSIRALWRRLLFH